MAKQNTNSTPAQGGGSAENQNNLLSDLERSELTEARNEALNDAQSTDPNAPNYVAPKVEDPKQIKGTLQVSETPEWVQTILDSNQAVLESNQAVIAALEDLKSFADERSSRTEGPVTTKILIEDEFDEDADYEVAPGKDFADKSDFTKKYSEGDDVTHLGAERLKELLAKGLIVES
ncbi:hypothetical protein [Pedobacter agri]|uniref:hypothetical protein n=1 Tax=Pedobacter agri TaxID=454586 RepID=UPI00277E2F71|nr:hypothetical protein [Pedobacter agri]MDQ1139425.1 hypothetical protein [Pedobacter agri]